MFATISIVAQVAFVGNLHICRFPTEIGTRWEYKTGNTVEVYAIESVERLKANLTLVNIVRVLPNKLVPSGTFMITDIGLLEKLGFPGGMECSPPVRVLSFPIKLYEAWHEKYKFWFGKEGRDSFFVNSKESTTVPAGTFQTYKVESISWTPKGAAYYDCRWYADKVGIVKRQFGDIGAAHTIWVLHKYSHSK